MGYEKIDIPKGYHEISFLEVVEGDKVYHPEREQWVNVTPSVVMSVKMFARKGINILRFPPIREDGK